MPSEIVVHLIAAARPNFMKVAPLYHELAATDWCRPVLVHTGQHYDANMSDAFFQDLAMPKPDFHLGVGSGTHAEQTAGVMVAYEKVLMETPPHWIVVVGDRYQRVDQKGQRFWIVDVARPVQGHDAVALLGQSQLGAGAGFLDAVAHQLVGIDHDIADEGNALGRHTFG